MAQLIMGSSSTNDVAPNNIWLMENIKETDLTYLAISSYKFYIYKFDIM